LIRLSSGYSTKKKILALAALFVVALIGYTLFTINEKPHESRSRSPRTRRPKHRTISGKSPRITLDSPQPENAQLQLAALLRDEGKLDEANAHVAEIHLSKPRTPDAFRAWLALAEKAEAAGKQDDALTGYQKVLTTFPGSYAAPLAMLGQGRVQKLKVRMTLPNVHTSRYRPSIKDLHFRWKQCRSSVP
jgi:tetratricopeptide (TPR) repeat protein